MSIGLIVCFTKIWLHQVIYVLSVGTTNIREKYTFKISIIFLFYNSKLNVLNVVRQLIAKRLKGRHNFVFIKFETL